MTATTDEPRTVQELARSNAEWVAGKLADGDVEALQFLKYRPVREVTDVLDAAKRADLVDTVACMTDALRLAQGHTGGASPTPTGYEPIVYPVTPDEVAQLLAAAGDATKLLRLPGTERGWTWSHSIEVDPDSVEVVVRLKPRHPRLERP